MASPLLLVADDLALIASVKRALATEGYELVLATSAADAIIAFGHHLPGLILLQPSVEQDRGGVVLEELALHPEAALVRVLLLGESIPGFAHRIEPLPVDPTHLLTSVAQTLRGASEDAEEADLVEASASPQRPPPPPSLTPQPPPPTPPPALSADELEDALFGDLPSFEEELHRDIEAQAIASIASTLPKAAPDSELDELEAELRAEADRRRAPSSLGKPTEAQPPSERAAGPGELEEASFALLDELAAKPAPEEARPAGVEPGDEGPTEKFSATARRPTETKRKAPAETFPPSAFDEAGVGHSSAPGADAAQARDFGTPAPTAPPLPASSPPMMSAPVTAPPPPPMGVASPPRAPPLATPQPPQALAAALVVASDEEAATAVAQAHGQLLAARERRAQELAEASNRQGQLERERAEAQAALGNLKGQLEERDIQVLALEEQLLDAQGQLAAARTDLDDLRREIDRQKEDAARVYERLELAQHDTVQLERRRGHLEEQLAAIQRDYQALLASSDATTDELAANLTRLKQLEQELDAERLRQVQLGREAQDALERVQLEATQTVEEERQRSQLLEEALQESRVALERARLEREALEAAQTDLADENAGLQEKLAETVAQLDGELEEARERAEQAEAVAQEVGEKVKELENRAVMPLSMPGRQAIGVPRSGSASVERLSQLVSQLAVASAQVRVDLGCAGGTRSLWLDKGRVVAAESSLPYEGLIDRARRDGLIDSRQEGELRMLRGAPPREQLEVLRARGFIRDEETVPLVQRFTEAIVLEALSEPTTHYRITDGPPAPEVLAATAPRATLPLVADALRRSLSFEALLESLGGSEAVVVPLESELDLRSLGFSERERKMLAWVNGEASVEDVAMASGLKPEVAFRALAVARALGVVQLKPTEKKTPRPAPDLDVRRLEAKYDEVQEADYFAILGLPRTAGSEEVREASERLSQEFDPLKFSGHPDASLQARAQVVHGLIEEASKALSDERRRVEYAQHLLD